jgi:hypothetical protein
MAERSSIVGVLLTAILTGGVAYIFSSRQSATAYERTQVAELRRQAEPFLKEAMTVREHLRTAQGNLYDFLESYHNGDESVLPRLRLWADSTTNAGHTLASRMSQDAITACRLFGPDARRVISGLDVRAAYLSQVMLGSPGIITRDRYRSLRQTLGDSLRLQTNHLDMFESYLADIIKADTKLLEASRAECFGN